MNVLTDLILLLWLTLLASVRTVLALTPGAASTGIWEKSVTALESRLAESLQLAGRHRGNGISAYDLEPDSLLATKTGLKPVKIHFSQRTVSAIVRQYANDMASGNWDWSRFGPLRVMERKGQWVSYDNRRLMAAQQAKFGNVPVEVVQSSALMPESSLTWEQAFTRRFADPRNLHAGGVVPNTGIPTQPVILPPRR